MTRPRYSYSDAGFNGFLRRTLNSNPNANTLKQSGVPNRNTLNFDQMLVSGSLGDKLSVGRVVINGKDSRIQINDELGNEVVRIGGLDG